MTVLKVSLWSYFGKCRFQHCWAGRMRECKLLKYFRRELRPSASTVNISASDTPVLVHKLITVLSWQLITNPFRNNRVDHLAATLDAEEGVWHFWKRDIPKLLACVKAEVEISHFHNGLSMRTVKKNKKQNLF